MADGDGSEAGLRRTSVGEGRLSGIVAVGVSGAGDVGPSGVGVTVGVGRERVPHPMARNALNIMKR